MIKAVLFDIDGVLIDSFESNLAFLQEFFKTKGYNISKRAYKPLYYKSLWDVIQAITGITDKKEIRKLWNAARSFDRNIQSPIMMKGAVRTVKLLGKKYMLGIVTNRIKIYAYEPPLDSIRACFDASVVYEDTKNHKPHPEPLLLAAKSLKLKPDECVYIGDAETDMAAAKAAGMKFIFYSTKRAKGNFVRVKSFGEIPNSISNLKQMMQ